MHHDAKKQQKYRNKSRYWRTTPARAFIKGDDMLREELDGIIAVTNRSQSPRVKELGVVNIT